MSRVPAAQSAFLASLAPSDLAAIESRLRDVALKVGTVLYEPGDTIEYVYFPTSGMVSVVTNMTSGQQVETGIIGRTGVVGSAVGTEMSFNQCMVQIAGEGRRLPRDCFRDAYENSKAFRGAVNRHNMFMWAVAQQSAACNAVHVLEARLARWLLDSRDLIQSNDIPLTQEFLSLMLGVQRTSVSLAARQLVDAGLINVRRGHVHILDAEGLSAKACSCHATIQGHRERLAIPLH